MTCPMTAIEAHLVGEYERARRAYGEYERARRAYGEFRHQLLGCVMTVLEIDPRGIRVLPWRPTVFEDAEMRAKRHVLLDFLEAQDALREHVLEEGPVETEAGVYAIGPEGELWHRRRDALSLFALAQEPSSWN